MLQFLAGFTLGNVVGMYLAQNYDLFGDPVKGVAGANPSCQWAGGWIHPGQVPNIAKKIDAFKKDVEAKKKPPE